MGRASRDKGRRGEREAALLLEERDYTITATLCGTHNPDMLAVDACGTLWAIEVKNCRLLDLPSWKKQAREQAKEKKARWLLLCRIEDYYGTWLALDSEGCHVWRAR